MKLNDPRQRSLNPFTYIFRGCFFFVEEHARKLIEEICHATLLMLQCLCRTEFYKVYSHLLEFMPLYVWSTAFCVSEELGIPPRTKGWISMVFKVAESGRHTNNATEIVIGRKSCNCKKKKLFFYRLINIENLLFYLRFPVLLRSKITRVVFSRKYTCNSYLTNKPPTFSC